MCVEEYIRVARLTESRDETWEPALFVYDADEELLEIFAVSNEGSVSVDAPLAARLDELGVGYKTARGDRPCALVVPETEHFGQQKLGMTRAIGDFYMQYHGCTWEPAVSCIDLFDLVTQLSQVMHARPSSPRAAPAAPPLAAPSAPPTEPSPRLPRCHVASDPRARPPPYHPLVPLPLTTP